jgi:hypothetical protein
MIPGASFLEHDSGSKTRFGGNASCSNSLVRRAFAILADSVKSQNASGGELMT